MYVVFESFFVAIALWVVEASVFAYVFRKQSWKVHVPVQTVLFLLIWPITDLAFNAIYYKDTKHIIAKDAEELNAGTHIPNKCKDITYHVEPIGRWFFCVIPENAAIDWLHQQEFHKTNSAYCGPYDEYPKEVKEILDSTQALYFKTETKPNGAGATVTLLSKSIYLCQWYW